MKTKTTINFIFFTLLLLAVNLSAATYNDAIVYLHPLPDSKYHSTMTTIIVKLDTSYIDDITNLSSLITVTGTEGECSGETFFSSDNRTIIFKPENSFNTNDTISVTIETSQFSVADYTYTFYTEITRVSSTTTSAKETTEVKSAQSYEATTSSGYQLINGMPVPSDFPDMTTEIYGETAPGLIFLADHSQYFIVYDNLGNIYYYLDGGNMGNVTVHPNNLLTINNYYQYDVYGSYLVFDSTFTIIDTIHGSHGYFMDSHEFQYIEHYHRLNVNEYSITRNLAHPDSTPKYSSFKSEIIHEHDSVGNVIFEWRDFDYTDFPITSTEIHMNSLDIDYDGHILASTRNSDEVWKIHRETGEVIWRLGGESNMFDIINDTCIIDYQHDFRPVKGQPNHYTIFDNKGNCDAGASNTRVIEYLIDTNNWTAEVVWEYSNNDYSTGEMGSAQRFENGNTFIDYQSDFLEVNEAGDLLFEAHFSGINYRCRRYAWYGKTTKPRLSIEKTAKQELGLYFCQFGDSAVQYYNIYHGLKEDDLSLYDTTSAKYYVNTFNNFADHYFAVSAVDTLGNESELSEIKSVSLYYSGIMKNIVRNGDFSGTYKWIISTSEGEGIQCSRAISDGEMVIDIDSAGNSLSDITLYQLVSLTQDQTYYFEFDAWANTSRVIEAKLSKQTIPYTNYSKNGASYLTTQKQHFAYTFTMEDDTDLEAMLRFDVGNDTGKVYLDNVSLKEMVDGVNPEFEIYKKVNFQLSGETTPTSYSKDTGQVYIESVFGWNTENLNAEIRESATDIRCQNFNYLKKGSQEYTWEIDAPETQYAVVIVMGDADSTNQVNQVYIEGNLVDDEDGEDNYDEIVLSDFDVTDGRLTITPGPDAVNAKIDYIDIYYYEKAVGTRDYFADQFLNLNIYPNPATNQLTIDLDNDKNQHIDISLYDMQGRRILDIYSGYYPEGEYKQTIDVSELPQSIYLLSIGTESQIVTQKVLLK